MDQNTVKIKPVRHPSVVWSRFKLSWPFLIWLAAALLGVYMYFHGGQFAAMSGTVKAHYDNVAVLEAGKIKKINVKVGDHVKKGDLLIQMDTRLLEAQRAVLQARLNHLAASADYEKIQNERR